MSPQPNLDELIGRLPLPLAKLRDEAEVARHTGTAHEFFSNAYYLWEATVRLLAVIALSEYVRGARPRPAPADVDLTTLPQPSIGHWLGYLRLFLGAARPTPGPIERTWNVLFNTKAGGLECCTRLHAILPDVVNGTNPNDALKQLAKRGTPSSTVNVVELFDRISNLRNRVKGHGADANQPDWFCQPLGQLLIEAQDELLPRLTALTELRLVYVAGTEVVGHNTHKIKGLDLTGTKPESFSVTVSLPPDALPPAQDRVYLEWDPRPGAPDAPTVRSPNVAALRSLHPLALFNFHDPRVVLFLNTDLGKKSASYLCYHAPNIIPDAARADETRDHLFAAQKEFLDAVLGNTAKGTKGAERAPRSVGEDAVRAGSGVSTPSAPAHELERRQVLGRLERELCAAVAAAAALTPPMIRTAYLGAAPPSSLRTPVAEPSDATEAPGAYCRDLADNTGLVKGKGEWPLLSFARALVGMLPAGYTGALPDAIRSASDWIGERNPPPVPAPGATPPLSQPAPGAGAAAAPGQPAPVKQTGYLTIAVCRSKKETDRYLVKAWLDTPAVSKCLADGATICASADLEADLKTVIDRIYTSVQELVDPHGLWVEMFLPRELIPAKVDLWEVRINGLGAIAIGTEHPVLIRAADRYYPSANHRQWQTSFEELRARWSDVTATTTVHVTATLPPPGSAPKVVYRVPCLPDGRTLYRDLRNHTIFGAVLSAPPATAPRDWDVLNTLLFLGVPAVAWSRRAPESTDELAQQLNGCLLRSVPTQLHGFRAGAIGDAEHHGNYVALFWDDPTRTPPELDAEGQLEIPAFGPPEFANG